ncbi:kelch-like protein 32 isoform X4 [Meles meles]|uniref:kelch-like protein 32 isoform X4 n=1 Tax=Meles meles TaxID=9662 RepID=UPI001E699899|nr:kelch-like protein 32 isoform X4 [Meles meles]
MQRLFPGNVQSLYGGKWSRRGEFTRCDQPWLEAGSGVCIHRPDFVGAGCDPGCASSWQSPTTVGASQFMFPLSYPGGVTNTAQYQNRLMVYEPNQNKWISRSPMLQRRVYHSMAAVQRKLYVLGGNDLDYNNDRILVRHIDSYDIDTDQWTRCNFNLLTGQNESGVAVHNERIYLVGGYSIWTNEPLACIQVVDVSREGKEEVFYGPTLPFASNGIAACFLPAPYFTCPNLQTLQVPHHRIGTI